MQRILLVLLAVAGVSCGPPAPSASPYAAELDALENPGEAGRPGAVTPSSDVPTPVEARPAETAATFAGRAAEALRMIDTQVKDATAPYERLEADTAAARGAIDALGAQATTAAERNVAFLLNSIVTNEADIRTLASVKPRDPSAGLPPMVTETVRVNVERSLECRTELSAWLAVARGAAPARPAGPCLQRVTEARDFRNRLGGKP